MWPGSGLPNLLPAAVLTWIAIRMQGRKLAASPEYLRCLNRLCISHERFDPCEHHIRINAERHFSWHAASAQFAGTSSRRARQRCREAWCWLDCDNSRIGSWTAHRSRKELVRYANQSTQADHRRPDTVSGSPGILAHDH